MQQETEFTQPLIPRIENQILDTLVRLERSFGKATTRAIARQIGLCAVQTWRYLHWLEQQGYVRRVGQRGGWKRSLHS